MEQLAQINSFIESRVRVLPLWLLAGSLLWLPNTVSTLVADEILLRNLTTRRKFANRTVESFDEDGVRLDSDVTLAWYEIDPKSSVENDSERFRELLNTLSPALLRIRQGLEIGDFKSIAPPAEDLYSRYANRQSSTAYMVIQSVMWGRLATGQREAAVEPYLRAYDYLRTTQSEGRLPGQRRLQYDPGTALCSSLIPIWFDKQAADEALQNVFRIGEKMTSHPQGLYIYAASLASTAGDPDRAKKFLAPVKSGNPVVAQWRRIIEAQIEIEQGEPGPATEYLEVSLAKFAPLTKPAALYWVGYSKVDSQDEQTRREGIWRLLHLPAEFAEETPELAGAGLYFSMLALGDMDDTKGSIALRRELLMKYSHTVHAQRVQSQSKMNSPN